MRAMFVACCLGLLVGVVASPVHARAFCKSKDCQQTSVRKVAPKHAATSVQKGHKHAATPVHKLAPNHTATSVQKGHKHAATPVHKLAPNHTATSVQKGPKHAATSVHKLALNTPRPPMLRSTRRRRPLRSTPLCTAPRGPFTLPRPSLNRIRRGPRAASALRRKHAMTL